MIKTCIECDRPMIVLDGEAYQKCGDCRPRFCRTPMCGRQLRGLYAQCSDCRAAMRREATKAKRRATAAAVREAKVALEKERRFLARKPCSARCGARLRSDNRSGLCWRCAASPAIRAAYDKRRWAIKKVRMARKRAFKRRLATIGDAAREAHRRAARKWFQANAKPKTCACGKPMGVRAKRCVDCFHGRATLRAAA